MQNRPTSRDVPMITRIHFSRFYVYISMYLSLSVWDRAVL